MSNNKKVNQPHDKIIKKLLSNPEAAKDILTMHLPEKIRCLIDLDNLILQRDSFISDEHRAFAVDLLFKTTFQHEPGYLWVLVEHQRKEDPWLPLRIFVYMGIIWDHIRRTSKAAKIPLIYPLVIYNGDRPTFADLIEPDASKVLFNDFFKTPFNIIDLAKIQDEELKKEADHHIKGVILLMTMKHIFNKNFQFIFENFLLEGFKKLDRIGSRDDLADLLYYLLNEALHVDNDKFWSIIHQEFSSEVEDKVMTIAQKLKSEGIKEGMTQGEEKNKLETAKRLLQNGQNISFIKVITQLSEDKIRQLMATASLVRNLSY